MMLFGGYSTDSYNPDGPEGALSAETFLLRPAEASWRSSILLGVSLSEGSL